MYVPSFLLKLVGISAIKDRRAMFQDGHRALHGDSAIDTLKILKLDQ